MGNFFTRNCFVYQTRPALKGFQGLEKASSPPKRAFQLLKTNFCLPDSGSMKPDEYESNADPQECFGQSFESAHDFILY
jgi:hypothetical protein